MGGKSSAPPAPDYTGAAIAQGQISQDLANQNTWANRPTQNTPWGSTSWQASQAIDPATGKPMTAWTQNQTLDPALQSALDDQLAIQAGRSGIAGSFLDRVRSDYATPFNWAGAPGMAQTPNAQFTSAGNVQQSIPQYDLDKSRLAQTTQTTNEPAFAAQRQALMEANFNRMQPTHARQQDQLETQLVNQGFTRGGAGWNEALQQLQQNQAGERWNALEQSGQEQARMQQMLLGQQQQAFGQAGAAQQAQNQALLSQFGMGGQAGDFYNQAQQQMYGQNLGANQQNFQQMMQQAQYQNQLRQQYISEEAMKRGMSLNELNALLTGQQVQTPGMPGFNTATMGQAPNLLGAAQSQGQYGMQAADFNAKQSDNMWGNIGQMAGMAAMFMSDRRLKSNIKRVGTHPLGVGIYEYDIFGHRERGVMADEVLQVRPDLVALAPSGFMMVNYGGL